VDALDLYLARQSEGGTRDSEGVFTISAERALDKLATHQLPRTSAWILKMVQAGVVASASGMWVTHGTRNCKLRYTEGRFGSLEQIREAWVEPVPISEQVHRHLSVGLRTVAFARRRPVLLVHNCPEQGLRSLFWDGSSLSRIGPAGDHVRDHLTPGEFVVYVSGSPLGRDEAVKKNHGVSSDTASEFKELTNNAVCCPVPLWADSRPISHFGVEDVSMIRKSLAFSAQHSIPGQPSLLLPPPLSKSCGFQQAGLAWTLYHSTRPEVSRLCWVKDGVVCEEEHLSLYPANFQVRLFASADDLEADLTELQLRFPGPELRQQRTAAAVLGFCQELSPTSQLLSEISKSHKIESEGNWGMATLLVLGGLLFAPVTSGYSFLISLGVAARQAFKRPEKIKVAPELVGFVTQLQNRYHRHE